LLREREKEREREREREEHVSRRFCCQNYVTSVINERFNMEHWWNDTDGKTEVLVEKPVSVPLCPPQISRGIEPRPPKPWTNRLSH